MPMFEYRCKRCGHVTVFLESAGSRKAHPCEDCGSKATEKVFSTFAAPSSGSGSAGSSCPTGTCPLS